MKIGETIYLDHQATTPVGQRILAEMATYHTDLFGNPHSSDHSFGWESARAVEEATARFARLIGADADEITFTSGATESNNLALLGLAQKATGGDRRRILVSSIEHKSVLAVSQVLEERYGFIVEKLPVDHEGIVPIPVLEDTMDNDVLAVSIMAVNNEIGTIQDIKKLSECVHKYGTVFHCDAAQAPLGMATESLAMYTDILSFSGHKMYGPKGVGSLFVARGLEQRLEPLFYGGGQQNGLRPGTVPVPLCVGLGAAADFLASKKGQEMRAELRRRRDAFVGKLNKLEHAISENGPVGHARHPGNANIHFIGFSAHDILGALQPHLAASTGSACTSGIPETSHVLKAIGLSSEAAESSIRFSLGIDTTDENIEEAVALIEKTLRKLSKAMFVHTA